MNQNLDNLRHSATHLLAAAAIKLWPQAKRAIGPAIEAGFYYDFDFGDTKISEIDFPKIEAEMHRILKSWDKFERREMSPEEAKKIFADNPYKLELIEDFAALFFWRRFLVTFRQDSKIFVPGFLTHSKASLHFNRLR